MTADFDPAARAMTQMIEGLSDDQLNAPTPCETYRVADLLEHIGTFAVVFTAAAQKDFEVLRDPPGPGDASNLPDDWRTRIPADLAGMAQAWRDSAAWDGMTRIGGGDTPGQVAGLVGVEELVVHGWDLARASGQDYPGDDTSIEVARSALVMFQKPGEEPDPGHPFGKVVDVADSATPLDQVIALSGRDPSWTPA